MTRLNAIAFAALCALTLSGCYSTEVDSNGRWVGGAKTMTTWADTHVPATWDRVNKSVTYEDIHDDFDNDTKRDRTRFIAAYRGVSEEEFRKFGEDTLKIHEKMECDPYDVSTSQPEEKPYVKQCFLDLYAGRDPMPREFDFFAAWTGYPDGTSTVDLFMNNDPH